MTTYVVAYVSTGVVFLVVDAIWLSQMSQVLYRPVLGELLLERFKPVPAILFYLVYVLGVVVFAVAPALTSGRWSTAAVYGALLGLVAYATYNLTNQATLKGWSWTLAISDICWGTFLTATAAVSGLLITRAIEKILA